MLCVNGYDEQYVADCRAKIVAQIAAYEELVASVRAGGRDAVRLDAAIAAFEPVFFDNLVLALDNFFVHRGRTSQAEDGDPLNEVRVLSNSTALNGGTLTIEKAIKLTPATSVLGLEPGA